ncbi:hypothetical protein QC762_118310 [Podospora pseudocomata]|uniref:Galactose oxidase n=1 Tax=Podospora pseudocomata TaxID=2093779 RepID=A0ABR0GX87_9PEZI|nr:hypothetical protein QC762_118310 [Podospora pseudocomata]
MSGLIKIASLAVVLFLFLALAFQFQFNTSVYVLVQQRQEHANARNIGRWEQSILLPIVPVAIAVLPRTGKVLAWAADKPNVFSNATTHTLSVIYDPSTHQVNNQNVTITHHNMFCPGLSLDTSGRVVVTGGSTSDATSIYDEVQGRWLSGPPLTVGRGYHSQATLSDGRVFTIGGSWSGPLGGKNGEILDPNKQTWTALPNTLAEPLLTSDFLGPFAGDNHAWLFAWRNDSVFQAGPSRAMNWYGVSSSGACQPAGTRGKDSDSMNGNAVMYDALAGKILAVGGARHYNDAAATNATHIVTLPSDPFTMPHVQELKGMKHPRAYANSVLLPTGEVLITGGATYAKQWADVNATLVPELFNPDTLTFTPLAKMPIPRTYHSVAVLLPDATVLTGGGGLCWEKCLGPEEEINHLDLQRFTPPYLLSGDPRPKILEISDTEVDLGGVFELLVDGEVAEVAMVRYSSATHAINTDQRRVRLVPTVLGKQKGRALHRVEIPEDGGVVVPGYWMVFAISSGKGGMKVPSVAETILIRAK